MDYTLLDKQQSSISLFIAISLVLNIKCNLLIICTDIRVKMQGLYLYWNKAGHTHTHTSIQTNADNIHVVVFGDYFVKHINNINFGLSSLSSSWQ